MGEVKYGRVRGLQIGLTRCGAFVGMWSRKKAGQWNRWAGRSVQGLGIFGAYAAKRQQKSGVSGLYVRPRRMDMLFIVLDNGKNHHYCNHYCNKY